MPPPIDGGTGASGGSASGSFPAGTNGSDGHGGGIYASSSSPTLQNTIFYENQTGGDCPGTITDGGHNLVFALSQLGGVVPDPCNLSGFSFAAEIQSLRRSLTMAARPRRCAWRLR